MAEYESLTVAELKDLLRERELPVSGKKAELIARLEEHDSSDDVEQPVEEMEEVEDDFEDDDFEDETDDDFFDDEWTSTLPVRSPYSTTLPLLISLYSIRRRRSSPPSEGRSGSGTGDSQRLAGGSRKACSLVRE